MSSLWDKEALTRVILEIWSLTHQREANAKPQSAGTVASHPWENQESPAKVLHRKEANIFLWILGGIFKAEGQALIRREVVRKPVERTGAKDFLS